MHIRVRLDIFKPLLQSMALSVNNGEASIKMVLVYERLPNTRFHC